MSFLSRIAGTQNEWITSAEVTLSVTGTFDRKVHLVGDFAVDLRIAEREVELMTDRLDDQAVRRLRELDLVPDLARSRSRAGRRRASGSASTRTRACGCRGFARRSRRARRSAFARNAIAK